MISLNVNLTFRPTNLPRYQEFVNKRLNEASKLIAKLIERYAQEEHRYEHRTGTLKSATKSTSYSTATKKIISSYIDDGIADYGKYISKGFKSWEPDPFISDAIQNHWSEIMAIIDRHLEMALNDTFN